MEKILDRDIDQLVDKGLQSDALESLSEAISSGRKLEEVLDLIVHRAQDLLPVSKVFIFLIENEHLVLKAASEGLPQTPLILPLDETIESWVSQRGKIVALGDPQADNRFKNRWFYGKGNSADNSREQNNPVGIVAAPIRSGLNVVGVLSIIQNFPHADADTDIQTTATSIISDEEFEELIPFVAVLTDLVSLALENSQMLQSHQRRSQLIDLLNIISKTLVDKPVEELAQRICDLICEATGAEKCDIVLHSIETDEFVAFGKSNTSLSLLEQELGLDHIPLQTSGCLLRVYQGGEAFLAGKLPKGDELPLLEKTKIESLIVVPLEVEQDRLGLLSLASTKENAFNEDDLNFVCFISIRLGYSLQHKELTQELAQAEKTRILHDAQENFVNILAHDLKNTLTAIKGNSQLGLRRLKRGDTSFGEKALQIVTSKADQAIRLVADMVEVSQLERGSYRLLVAPLDLVALIQEEIESIQEITSSHNIMFETSLSEVYLIADKNRLVRVLNNLLINALRYSPQGSTINVIIAAPLEQKFTPLTREVDLPTTDPNNIYQSVMVTVKDQGEGISLFDQDHIFERFYRGAGAQLATGSGLGLYICREIITLHGGRLWVESQPGQGASFHFTLPYNG
jgi:signal transduction histidine kinase